MSPSIILTQIFHILRFLSITSERITRAFNDTVIPCLVCKCDYCLCFCSEISRWNYPHVRHLPSGSLKLNTGKVAITLKWTLRSKLMELFVSKFLKLFIKLSPNLQQQCTYSNVIVWLTCYIGKKWKLNRLKLTFRGSVL